MVWPPSQLSKELYLAKSSAHRLILSLVARNFIIQDTENERYQLSIKFVNL
ncbi:helix-turn-helix domain-containing protein [Sporosarcina obsidiansis]|uniref:helix-turn-helix domain-containing protein n=1 Tax=Sporosarcina obsidiansis TaxID=2660748 RepID=UPI00129A8DB3